MRRVSGRLRDWRPQVKLWKWADEDKGVLYPRSGLAVSSCALFHSGGAGRPATLCGIETPGLIQTRAGFNAHKARPFVATALDVPPHCAAHAAAAAAGSGGGFSPHVRLRLPDGFFPEAAYQRTRRAYGQPPVRLAILPARHRAYASARDVLCAQGAGHDAHFRPRRIGGDGRPGAGVRPAAHVASDAGAELPEQ